MVHEKLLRYVRCDELRLKIHHMMKKKENLNYFFACQDTEVMKCVDKVFEIDKNLLTR